MDLLRLPSALRRSIIHQYGTTHILKRLLSTTTTRNATQTDPSPSPAPETPLLTLTPSTLNTYTITTPPDATQLRQANAFFSRHDPTLLFTVARFLELPPSPYPEVAVLGRSNVGKSSLLNALFDRPRMALAHVSKKPGKTRTINGYGVGGDGAKSAAKKKGAEVNTAWKSFGRGGLIVVDMPGYGQGSREDWGKEIMKYLESRKQLRRTYIMIDAEHGLKKSDLSLITYLRQHGVPYQIVLSKVDKILFPRPKEPIPTRLSTALGKLQELRASISRTLNEEAQQAGMRRDTAEDILCCSGNSAKVMDQVGRKRRMIGVDELRWNILTACGMEESGGLKLGKNAQQKEDASAFWEARRARLEGGDE